MSLARRSFLSAASILLVLGAAVLALPAAVAAEELQVTSDSESVTILSGSLPLAKYRYQQNPAKPYFAELFSPSGVQVLRDSPADHKHHHGLMFAVAVDGVDFWSETEKCGQQRHVSGEEPRVESTAGMGLVRGEQRVEWNAPDGKEMLQERRLAVIARLSEPAATLIGWGSTLEPPTGKDSVTLSGSSYFGLGMRFVPSMDKGGKFFNADGKTGVEGTNKAKSAWCAYTAKADGKPVTVVMLTSPENPRPTTWFTMDQGFAYLSATLNLETEPLKIEANKPLKLAYGVVVFDGEVDKAKIDALYQQLKERAKQMK
jgi:LacI family transcriptional regulator